ncbi:MAG: methylisocitrate lyase [Phycisphaerae bacterium]|nr:methylisocitrate lyase [Phycisphaerae bacterium]
MRRLIADRCIAMPGAFNAYTARLIESAGFDSVYISGAGLANATAGVPDVGLLGLDEVVRLCAYIVDAVAIPAIADADTGFGGLPNVARTLREMERIGLAGIHLEDQEFPKRCGHLAGKTIVAVDEMVDRIKAAVDARLNQNVLLIARTDARASEGIEAAIERAHSYLAAGADAVFPEALQSSDEFKGFADAIKAPLLANMTEFGKSPLLSVDELASMGYRMVIFPQSIFRVASKTTSDFLADLHQFGSQSEWVDRMQSRADLYRTLRYDPSANRWPDSERVNDE